MKINYSLSEIKQVVTTIMSELTYKTVLFYGDMGVGKTTLIKEMAKALGVTETISSPTFSIVNEYKTRDDILYHFDFYRITDETEALDFGVEEYLNSSHYNFIEWPEKIKGLLPVKTTSMYITKNPDGSRNIKIMPMN